MRAALSFIAATVLSLCRAEAEEWPQFRGPGGQGHSSEKGLPLCWHESEGNGEERPREGESAKRGAQNIAWKVPIPGRGWSSPVVGGGKIWLTTASAEGRSLRALAVERDSGRLLHDVEVFHKEDPGSIHPKNSHASPTPVLAGEHVYVHYGAHGTACLAFEDGRVIWRAELKYAHRHGPAGSPVLFGDLLILSCDGTDVQYVIALDKETGKTRWKKDRAGPMAYSTPLVIRVNGQDQVVSTGGNRVASYEPKTGAEVWSARYEGYSLVPRPVYGHGLVFICTGYNTPDLYAIRADGKGDVTETHVAWTVRRGVPHNPSPLLVGDELYFVSDGGVASCVDAASGKSYWQKRLEGAFSASPLYADGRIYLLNEEGVTVVIAPGRQFKELATNRLPGRTLASMAISGKAIYLRTESHLYRLEEPRAAD